MTGDRRTRRRAGDGWPCYGSRWRSNSVLALRLSSARDRAFEKRRTSVRKQGRNIAITASVFSADPRNILCLSSDYELKEMRAIPSKAFFLYAILVAALALTACPAKNDFAITPIPANTRTRKSSDRDRHRQLRSAWQRVYELDDGTAYW